MDHNRNNSSFDNPPTSNFTSNSDFNYYYISCPTKTTLFATIKFPFKWLIFRQAFSVYDYMLFGYKEFL